MGWAVTLLADLRRMKEEMDRVWGSHFEESEIAKEQEMWRRVGNLAKFDGTGRKSLRSRSIETIKF